MIFLPPGGLVAAPQPTGGGGGFTPGSLLFDGGAIGSVDENRLAVPRTGTPGSLVSVGNEDFTIEFFVRCTGDNETAQISPGPETNWTITNIIIDGDTAFRARGWGFGIGGGRFCFGLDTEAAAITVGGGGSGTDWRVGTPWVHVAGERRRSDGRIRLYVNGAVMADQAGPTGDLSYPGGSPVSQCGPGGNISCAYSDTVIAVGVEKADLDHAQYPGFFGNFGEWRISNVLRYGGSPFTPPSGPFTTDANTLALYHFDPNDTGIVVPDFSGNAVHGELRVGANGPVRSVLAPF